LLSQKAGANVLLSGQNGDLVMGNLFDDSLQISACFRRFRLSQAFKDALQWSKVLRLPVYRVLCQAACAALPPVLAPVTVYGVEDGAFSPHSTETSLVPDLTKRLGVSNSTDLFSDIWMKPVRNAESIFALYRQHWNSGNCRRQKCGNTWSIRIHLPIDRWLKFVGVGDLGCGAVPNPVACQMRRVTFGFHALPFAASPSTSQSQSGLYQKGDQDIDDEAAQLTNLHFRGRRCLAKNSSSRWDRPN
jgi:hypothetical protein